MVAIVSHIQQYVLYVEYTAIRTIDDTSESVPVPSAVIHYAFFGGDQLTAARIRSAQKHMCNADTPVK